MSWKAEWAGAWKEGTCGGCINNPTWRNNPQVFVKITTETHLDIVLRQRADDGDDLYGVGFYVCKSDGTINRQITITRKDVLAKSEFEDSEEVELKVLLKPLDVPYVVVICTFFPQELSDFTIHFSADQPFSLIPPRDPWTVTSLKGEWIHETASGSKSLESTLKNPQFLITPSSIMQCNFLLMQPKKTFNPIGMSVIRLTHSVAAKLDGIDQDEILAKSEFSSHRESLLDTTLHPEFTYVLVPYTLEPGHEGTFEILVYSTAPINASPLSPQIALVVESEWNEQSAGGCMNNITWRSNPQFLLTVKEKKPFVLRLRRKGEEKEAFGFYVTAGRGSEKRLIVSKSDEVTKTPFRVASEVSVECSLDPSPQPYAVIPTTFHPGLCGPFSLAVFSPDNVDVSSFLSLEKVGKSVFSRVLESSWKESRAGGCRNHPTWINNPQFLLRSTTPGKVTIVLAAAGDELTESGFYVFGTTDEVSSRLTKLFKSNVKGQTGYRADAEVELELELEAGMNYVILPSTFAAGVDRDFRLGVFAEHDDLTLQELL